MRLFTCLAALVMFLAGQSAATAQEITGGVKGGVNFATLSFDPDPEIDSGVRTGIAVGGFVTIPIGGALAIQPEALFSQKGTSLEEAGVSAKIKIDYLDVPVLVKYSTAPSTSTGTSVHFFGGPSIGFKLDASASGSVGGETIDVDIDDDDVESFDFGVVFGAGVQFGRVSIDGRYTFGLTNINNEDPDVEKVKTRTLAVLAGVRF
jgi:Outer membrane protein beta-barrel domain